MPTNFHVKLKRARLQAIIDGESSDGIASGWLQIQRSDDGVLVNFPMSALGSAVAGTVENAIVLTFTFIDDASEAGNSDAGIEPGLLAGTAVKAKIVDNAKAVDLITGLTAGAGGSEDIVLDNAVIAVDQLVTITGFTITHAADT